jgi:hypothetical protein
LIDDVEESLAQQEDFKDAFEEPTGLPQSRSHDHAIVLKQDA